MARETKEQKEQKEKAKKRVEELLGDTITFDIKNATEVEKKLDKIESKPSKEKNNSWLETEITRLSEINKELESKLVLAKEEYNKLLTTKQVGSTVEPVNVSNVEVGVRKLFNELRDNYEGNNPNRTKYTELKIRVFLEKFLQTFEFLRKK